MRLTGIALVGYTGLEWGPLTRIRWISLPQVFLGNAGARLRNRSSQKARRWLYAWRFGPLNCAPQRAPAEANQPISGAGQCDHDSVLCLSVCVPLSHIPTARLRPASGPRPFSN